MTLPVNGKTGPVPRSVWGPVVMRKVLLLIILGAAAAHRVKAEESLDSFIDFTH